MPDMITSASNGQIKNVIQLQTKAKVRRKQKCFVVEGIKMVLEAPRNRLVEVYVSEEFYESDKIERLKDIAYTVVSNKVFASMSDTVTPQGVMAIVRQTDDSLVEILKQKKRQGGKCFLVLEKLQDPGNLGTIIRTAEGVGISGVIMSDDTVDIYNPKVIRSTMGAIYRVPFVYVEDCGATIEQMKQHGIKVYAAHLKGEINCFEGDYIQDTCFLIGNEANGLSDELAARADVWMKIPMEGQVESLNAAIAATVFMYEAYRQNL